MRILAVKPGHDGAVACIEDGELRFSYEAEKDTYFRYMHVHPEVILEAMTECGPPDVLAVGGWMKGMPECLDVPGAGYFGWDDSSATASSVKLLGKETQLFRSTHERSHLAGGFGMSHLEEDEECYCLVWEGQIGAFYRLDSNGNAKKIGAPLASPGERFLFLYHVAHRDVGFGYDATAGKTMALAAYFDKVDATAEEERLLSRLLQDDPPQRSEKESFSECHLYNLGVDTPEYRRMARLLTDSIFERFEEFAKVHLTERLPLIITGGCGLNCEWNSRWRECGLFASVFVPPCANDSGSAIGTGLDALRHFSGKRKVDWSVYSGQEFRWDVADTRYERRPLDVGFVAERICNDGIIVPWVEGRCEIGPRALGHRSLLASATTSGMRDKLNDLKRREHYRPVAPVALQDHAGQWFSPDVPSPHMLYFYRVKEETLSEVRHVDGSARLQTVDSTECARLVQLLTAVSDRTGAGVLCNTSLNYPGCGFINRLSDLDRYSNEKQLELYVAGDGMYLRPNRI